MTEVRQAEEFSAWLHRLRDANAVARIVGRIRRMAMGKVMRIVRALGLTLSARPATSGQTSKRRRVA